MTILEDMEGELYGSSFTDIVGDTISYKPDGGSYGDVTCFVDYSDQAISFDGTQVVDQDISIEITKTAVPAKPNANCRIQLPKVSGATFKPVNIGTDQSGNCWKFQVKKVNV